MAVGFRCEPACADSEGRDTGCPVHVAFSRALRNLRFAAKSKPFVAKFWIPSRRYPSAIPRIEHSCPAVTRLLERPGLDAGLIRRTLSSRGPALLAATLARLTELAVFLDHEFRAALSLAADFRRARNCLASHGTLRSRKPDSLTEAFSTFASHFRARRRRGI